MYLVRTPRVLKTISPKLVWEIPPKGKELFLTFDDGPVPEVTPQVLDILAERGVKATFFCVGANVERHPEILADILDRGHSAGNHTFDHVDGWKIRGIKYYRNFLKGASKVPQGLFRPPYGRIRKEEAEAISHRAHIIMWDVLSADFDTSITPADCLDNCLKSRPGSIVVFHDSVKAAPRMLDVLPHFIDIMLDKGFTFSPIFPERLEA